MKNKFKRPAYYLASAAFVIVSLMYVINIINTPYIGLELNNEHGKYVVISCDPHGMGCKLGIRTGDIIVKIDQVDAVNYYDAQIWGEAEKATTIEYQKMGKSQNTIAQIPQTPVNRFFESEFPMVLLGLLFAFFGFITWFKRPLLAQAHAFFWLNWFLGLAIIIAPASSRDLLLARNLEYITLSAVPVLLLYFFNIFPVKNKNQINRYCLYWFIFLFLGITVLTILQSSEIIHFNEPLKKLVLINLSVGIFVVVINLLSLRKLPSNKPEKHQAGILLLGMVIGFAPFILFTALPWIVNLQPLLYTQVSYLFVSVIPFSWYFVIVNRYLPDSRIILRQVISFSLSAIIISLTCILTLFWGGVIKSLDLEVFKVLFSISLLVSIFFMLLHQIINKAFNKFRFLTGEQSFSQRVLRLNERLAFFPEGKKVLEEIVKGMEIEGAFLVAESENKSYFVETAGRYYKNLAEQSQIESYFHTNNRDYIGTKKLPADFPAEFYTHLKYNNYDCGLFLGYKTSHIKFSDADLPLITLISSQVTQIFATMLVIKELAQETNDFSQKLQNYQRKIQRLQGITGSLFRNIEQERKSIARDLHDGPLQLAIELERWLDEICEDCPCKIDGQDPKAITHIRQVVKKLNFELRSICSDLRPSLLSDLGLYFAIQSLCEEMMQKESIQISLETVGLNESTALNEEIGITAYRFIQEGILNAIKHSGTKKIEIKIELDQAKLDLSIRDFGKGFDVGNADNLTLVGDHFGLIGMKERLQTIDGELHINSIISQGTTVKASIPVKGGK